MTEMDRNKEKDSQPAWTSGPQTDPSLQQKQTPEAAAIANKAKSLVDHAAQEGPEQPHAFPKVLALHLPPLTIDDGPAENAPADVLDKVSDARMYCCFKRR